MKKKLDFVLYAKILNAIDLIGISLILLAAIGLQILLHELPCPLCLLQRLGLLAMGFGFLLNIYYEIRPAHYALSLLSAIFTGLAAFRQMLLHIVPGSGSYGDAVLGLHLYTWVFILAIAAIIYISILMSVSAQYLFEINKENALNEIKSRHGKVLCHFAFTVFFFTVLANAVSTFYECGIHECPDNPVSYLL